MDWLVTSIRENPELAIFLTLALGFVIGRVRLGTFSLGAVVGTLLAGVLVGQIGVEVDPLVKVVFFDLFLFATGYKVGPQFFRGLKQNALPQVALTVVLCVMSLVITLAAAKVMGYDSGTAAGLMAGAFTESTVIGTAGNTIARLDLPEAEKTRLLNNIPVAYAVSYMVGTGFIVWFLGSLAPRLLRVDLRAESRKLEAEGEATQSEAGTTPVNQEWDVRALSHPRSRRAHGGGARAVLRPRAHVRPADPPRRAGARSRPGHHAPARRRGRVRRAPPRPVVPGPAARGRGGRRLPSGRLDGRPGRGRHATGAWRITRWPRSPSAMGAAWSW